MNTARKKGATGCLIAHFLASKCGLRTFNRAQNFSPTLAPEQVGFYPSSAGASIGRGHEHSARNARIRIAPGFGFRFYRGRMIRKLYAITARVRALLAPKQTSADRSQLVGMYLEQANRPAADAGWIAANRERQNGKFAQNRRRG